jgi:hypothetical protein
VHVRVSMKIVRTLLPTVLGVVTGCGASDSTTTPSAATTTATHRFELSSADGAFVQLRNEGMILRPSPAPLVAAKEGSDFGRIYNRLPCQVGPLDEATNTGFAKQGFAEAPESFAAHAPAFLSSLSIELPDPANADPGNHDQDACYAYRTTDGVWHGHFEATPTLHDESARLRRITFTVNAAHVDMVAIVVGSAPIGSVSLVTRAE